MGQQWITDSDEPDITGARLRIELASGYFEQGKTTVALDEVKQALAADPSYAPAYNLRGLIYLRLGEPAGRVQLPPGHQAGAARWRQLAQPGLAALPSRAVTPMRWRPSAPRRADAAVRRGGQDPDEPGHLPGLCRSGADAERSLMRAFELMPELITSCNLASLLLQRKGFCARAVLHPAPEQFRACKRRVALAGARGAAAGQPRGGAPARRAVASPLS